MQKRKRVLLYLIKTLNIKKKSITKTFLDKLLFLLKKEYGADDYLKFYNFFPYNYGPFSNMYYYDLSDLKSRGLMDDTYNLSPEASTSAEAIQEQLKDDISDLAGRFGKGNIRDYVYRKYPEYSVKSKKQNRKEKRKFNGIFTIGYEGKDIDIFLDFLVQNCIDCVVDVRANPFSMNFSFIGKRLNATLGKVGITYVNFPELGIEGEQRKALFSKEDYQKLFRIYRKEVLSRQKEKLRYLADFSKKNRIALLCFEKDWHYCHRGILSSELEKIVNDKVIHL